MREHPDNRSQPSRPEEEIDKGLRSFLGGAVAAGAFLAMPAELRGLFSAVSTTEALPINDNIKLREDYITKLTHFAREELQSPLLQRALRGEGENPVSRVLRVVGIPILPEHVERTKFDVSELHRRYPVQITGSVARKNFSLTSAYDKSGKGPYMREQNANCFYWEDDTHVMTSGHVIKGDNKLREERSVDMGLIQVPQKFRASSKEQIIHRDPSVTNADIHGSLVAVVGIGVNGGSGEKSHKTYLGTAFRLEAGFVKANRRSTDKTWADHFTNSFAVVLPPGEDQYTQRRMSGSAVFVYKDGAWKFCGKYWSAQPTMVSRDGKTMVFGCFHGVDDLDAELKRPDLLRAEM